METERMENTKEEAPINWRIDTRTASDHRVGLTLSIVQNRTGPKEIPVTSFRKQQCHSH